MTKSKFNVKFMEQKLSKDGNKYLQLSRDVVIPGYTRDDGTRVEDVIFSKGTFVDLVAQPTDSDIESAPSEKAKAFLTKRAETWGGKYPESLVKEYHLKAVKDQ